MSGLGVFLQNELLNLSNEAKKKNPEIKDAVEHFLVILRTVKESFPNIEPGTPDPLPKALSESQDVMLPFTLSLDTKNPKLVQIAIGCIQRLISHRALPAETIPALIKSLSEQISGPMEIQLKILQAILPVVMNYRKISGQSFSDSLLLSYKLQETKSPIVNTTAAVTFRQLIVHAFERLENMNRAFPETPADDKLKQAYAQDAFLLFEDLCALGNGGGNRFLVGIDIERNFALELIEAVINAHPSLFSEHQELYRCLKDKICPTLIRCFSDKNNYPYMTRLIRLTQTIIKHLHSSLIMECEIFLSIYNKLFDSDVTPLWQKVLILEAYKFIVSDGPLHRAVFEACDHANPSSHPFKDMMMNIAKFVYSVQSYILSSPVTPHENSASKADTPGASNHLTVEEYALSIAESAVKVQCLDQLDKQEVPAFPETYPVYLAIQCILSITSSQYSMIMPTIQREKKENEEVVDPSKVLVAIELVKESCPATLGVMLLLLPCSIDEELYALLLKAFHEYTTLVGLLGLTSFRDALFSALCKASVPPSSSFSFDLASNSKEILPLYYNSQANLRTDALLVSIISDRNVSAMKVLLSVSESLIGVVDHRVWYAIFETLQIAESLLSSGKMNKRMESSPGLLEVSSPLASVQQAAKDLFRGRSSTMNSVPHNVIMTNQVSPSADNNYQAVIIQAKRLYEKSVLIDMKHMVEFMRALCRLATDTMGGVNVSQVGTPVSLKDNNKVGDDKSYAVSKIHLVTQLNLKRLLQDAEHAVWDMIISQLTTIAQSSNCSPTIRIQVCAAFGEIILAASQQTDFSDPLIERRVLEPIGSLIGFENSANNPEDKVASHIKGSWFVDVQKSGIEILNKLLQTSGQSFSMGWLQIMDILSWIARTSKSRRQKLQEATEASSSDTSSNNASKTLVRVAFPCVQLICADFLPLLSPTIISKCIDTVSAYGQTGDDLNMSLASVGLLWTICDFILSKRHTLEKSKATSTVQATDGPHEFDGSISINSRLDCNGDESSIQNTVSRSEQFTIQNIDSLWMSLLGNLSELCSDDRAEVRNSANQTLFRTLEMKGSKLTPDAWALCIRNVLIPLLERIQVSNEKALEAGRSMVDVSTVTSPLSRPQSPVLMGAKTASKSWDETKILTLHGVTKCMTEFLVQLLPLGTELETFWSRFVAFVTSNALNTSHDVSVASLKGFRQLILAFKAVPDVHLTDINKSLLLTLSTLAWDEWISLGDRIVSNSLTKKTITNADTGSMADLSTLTGIQFIDGTYPTQIEGYMSHECLNLWLSMFGDLFDQIQSVFQLKQLQKLSPLILEVLLYQTVPVPGGAAASRYRMDAPSDRDNLTSLQNTVVDILSNEKYPFVSLDYVVKVVIPLLSDMVKLPFVPSPAALFTPPTLDQSETPSMEASMNTMPTSKKFTYVALVKRSIQLLQGLFEKHGQAKEMYEEGAFEHVLRGLLIPMKLKYSCAQGSKDSIPLWKAAAVAAMDFIRTGLASLETYRNEFSDSKREAVYDICITVLDEFLLESSLPITYDDSENSSADEEFDISIVKELRDELVLRFAKPWVSDDILTRVLRIFEKGTILFVQPTKFGARITPDAFFSAEKDPVSSNNNAPEHVVKVSQEKTPVLGTDVAPMKREDFGFACIQSLFDLSSVHRNDETGLGVRISSFCAPLLLSFLKSRISFYVNEYPQWGDYPMPRIMQKELQTILSSSAKLQLRPESLVRAYPDILEDSVKQKLFTSASAHIFAIYGFLCDLLAVAHGKNPGTGLGTVSTNTDGTDIISLIKTCLSRVSTEIGTIQL